MNTFSYKTVKRSCYAEDYCREPAASTLCRNPRSNPRPLEAFLARNLPNEPATLLEESLRAIAHLKPDQLIPGHKIVTTYQKDYVSRQPKKAQCVSVPRTKPAQRKKLITSMQISYTTPPRTVNLKGNTSRYGCNQGIVRAAQGIIPTLTDAKAPLTACYQTWYKSEFANEKEKRQKSTYSQLRLPAIDARRVRLQLTTV